MEVILTAVHAIVRRAAKEWLVKMRPAHTGLRSALGALAPLCLVVGCALLGEYEAGDKAGGASAAGGNAGDSGSCKAADGSASVTSAPELDATLTQLATQYAPAGAVAVGSPLAGVFKSGQSLETQVQLQAGRCYTAVAAGTAEVSEVNVKFTAVTPIPGSAMVVAQDQDTGAQAVLGKYPNCHKNAAAMAVPVKLVLEVAAGCGEAAVQLYESQPCTMSEPASIAFSCTSDSTCKTHKCNTAFGRCAYPCQSNCDCALGYQCVAPGCVQ